jgi:hypothetical protein
LKQAKITLFYPLILVVYAVLALFAHNILFVEPRNVLRPLVISLVGTAAFLVILRRLVKDPYKAALICALGVVLFFSYGHVYALLKGTDLSSISRHRIILPLWILLFGSGTWWIQKKLRDAARTSETLSLISLLLVIFPLFQITSFHYTAWTARLRSQQEEAVIAQSELRPDIYYIVLDAYARADVIEDFYGYDNSPFLEQLRGLGFYVADCSQSNYARTNLSLTSSLNLNYILDIYDSEVSMPAWEYSLVRQTMEALGYTVVVFENGYSRTSGMDADVVLSPPRGEYEGLRFISALSEFEAMLIETSAGLLLTDSAALFPEFFTVDVENAVYQEHYRRTNYILEELGNLPELESPKFVMAHILVPHEPFIFSPEGTYLENQPETNRTPKPATSTRWNSLTATSSPCLKIYWKTQQYPR